MYDYMAAVKNDIRKYIDDNIDIEEYRGLRRALAGLLDTELRESPVTGIQEEDDIYTYFGDRALAEKALEGNDYWVKLVCERFERAGIKCDDPEYIDAEIRYHFFTFALKEVLDELGLDNSRPYVISFDGLTGIIV